MLKAHPQLQGGINGSGTFAESEAFGYDIWVTGLNFELHYKAALERVRRVKFK